MANTDLDSILRPFAHLVKSGGADRVAVLMFSDQLEEVGADARFPEMIRLCMTGMEFDHTHQSIGWGLDSRKWLPLVERHHETFLDFRKGPVTRMEEILREDESCSGK